jgi:hypothetical protein
MRDYLNALFDQWEKDVDRAETLLRSEKYFFEGLIVLSCYIGALARQRYPQISEDWKSYKKIISEYSDLNDIFENIDLLFFYQWPVSKLSNDKEFKKLKSYDLLLAVFKNEFGDEQKIKGSTIRYQKREKLIKMIKSKNVFWFDEGNFTKYIEMFSNNQILYTFVRCEAVHNIDSSLFNRSYQNQTEHDTYEDKHQVNREVVLNAVKNILKNIRQECLKDLKWPWQL